jgi:hypothetical protein
MYEETGHGFVYLHAGHSDLTLEKSKMDVTST